MTRRKCDPVDPTRFQRWPSYDKALDISLCQVLVDKEEGKEPCNHRIKGKYPTNLKSHLKSHHKNEFSKLAEQEDKEKKKME